MTPAAPGSRIARVLSAKGAIQDPAWHRVVLSVSRDAFVPATVWADTGGDNEYRPYPRTDSDVQRWLGEDVSLITQVDNGRPSDSLGRTPTSSISQPSLVVAMLHALDIEDGHKVLEIGTGSGYNTALLCERVGSDSIVSVEVDEEVAAAARENLHSLGYKPTLIVGDGEAETGRGPFDRLISTVAVRDIPTTWLDQVRPGGVIVTPWAPGPGFAESALLRLEVVPGAGVHGRLVGDAAFMMLRAHRPEYLGPSAFVDESDPATVNGTTTTSPRWVTDRSPGWAIVLGHLVPGLGYASYEAAEDNTAAAGEATVYVFDRAGGGSWALGEYTPASGPYEAKRCGPRDLWAEIGAARAAWVAAGRPGRDRLGVTVAPSGNWLWVDRPENRISPSESPHRADPTA
ncbi:protein-L-isoaspartate(D-aspartate) O-methyltransferase [Murinocardiopsis flavida]|uniref:Protein-L-isoaspartate O-methyltransferase n=1 Tax=Murinocardiopsis flavida TaxID=645275 RepID=A0A2P8CY85_9ACTN|nr:methyltransferase domain-containing protein [Murinocardiopsis flavida]PSK89925.1 protein-L-isoaspartate(D-aspartate) O-methyltransferase [Murinocardiopsis flavida]